MLVGVLRNFGTIKSEFSISNIELDISHVFKGKKIGKLLKKKFVGKSGPLIFRLDYVILFEYSFTPFNLVRCPSSFLGQ